MFGLSIRGHGVPFIGPFIRRGLVLPPWDDVGRAANESISSELYSAQLSSYKNLSEFKLSRV